MYTYSTNCLKKTARVAKIFFSFFLENIHSYPFTVKMLKVNDKVFLYFPFRGTI